MGTRPPESLPPTASCPECNGEGVTRDPSGDDPEVGFLGSAPCGCDDGRVPACGSCLDEPATANGLCDSCAADPHCPECRGLGRGRTPSRHINSHDVNGWSVEPGRTRADVLAVYDRAIAAARRAA